MSDTKVADRQTVMRSAVMFVVFVSVVSFFSDMNYEGARSITGQFLQLLGSSAAVVGIAVGAGELLGYSLRFLSGYWADRTGQYWTVALSGYVIQLFAMPLLALVSNWHTAVLILLVERIGKGIRNPARDAMLSYATKEVGRGWGYGLHSAMDQFGAFVGPLLMALVLTIGAVGGRNSLPTYHHAFGLLLIPAVIALALLLTARSYFPHPEQLESKTPVATVSGLGRRFWLYCIGGGLIGAGFADFALIAFHLKTTALVAEHLIPVLFAFGTAVDVVVSLLGGWSYDRRPTATLLVIFGAGGLFAPLAFLGKSVPVVLAGLALWGVAVAAQEAVLKAALADTIPASRRAYGFGTFSLIFGISWFAGSALMGLLYEHSILWLVVFSAVASVAAVPILLLARAVPAPDVHRDVSA